MDSCQQINFFFTTNAREEKTIFLPSNKMKELSLTGRVIFNGSPKHFLLGDSFSNVVDDIVNRVLVIQVPAHDSMCRHTAEIYYRWRYQGRSSTSTETVIPSSMLVCPYVVAKRTLSWGNKTLESNVDLRQNKSLILYDKYYIFRKRSILNPYISNRDCIKICCFLHNC